VSRTVDRKPLFHLLRGRSPDGSQQLVRIRKKKAKSKSTEHMPDFDMTFSVPKDVSDLWALATPEQRQTIERILKSCAKNCLDLLEAETRLIRRGKNGVRSEQGHLVAALFMHVTSRNNNDPNLHLHAVIPAIVLMLNPWTASVKKGFAKLQLQEQLQRSLVQWKCKNT
jgi:conjugative relaxase-like TrwC/TraI family protein